jgi:hypothetical protein
MGKSDAPEAPDPVELYGAQSEADVFAAMVNAALVPTQSAPGGSVSFQPKTYQKDRPKLGVSKGDIKTTSITNPLTGEVYEVPQYKQTVRLNPTQRRTFNTNARTQEELAGIGLDQTRRIGDLLGSNLSFDGLSAGGNAAGLMDGVNVATTYGDEGSYAEQRQRVEDALMARLNPQLDRRQEQLRTSLVNQGVNLGTEQYSRAMTDFGQQVNDAQLAAILGAGQEQTRLAGLDRDRAVFGNQAAQQIFNNNLAGFNAAETVRGREANELMTLRNQPINEITALLSGSQVSMPTFGSNPGLSVPNVDYAGLEMQGYENELAAWQQQNQNRNAIIGGLFGLGSAGITAGFG